MTVRGVALATVGLFAWLALPYSIKFVWAPALDRARLPLLGRRRGWLLVLQLAVAGAIAALGSLDPGRALGAVAVLALALIVLSASLDIVTDAFRADTLRPEERAAGSAMYILGYRLGMLAAGALALVLADRTSWQRAYLVMAGLMSIGVVATLVAREPEAHAAPRTLREAVVEPFRELLGRPGIADALAFVALYRLGAILLDQLKQPFLVQLGFAPAEIGTINKGVGLAAMVVGGLLAGAWVPRLGLRRALLGFGALSALVHASFAALALTGPSTPLLVACVAADSFCAGLAIAPFDGYLMSLTRRASSATHYALLTSLSGAAARVVVGGAGWAAAATGWPLFFGLTFAASLPALALLAARPGLAREA
jgi:PAT family beta-lactamase induction signal transducer AmpG